MLVYRIASRRYSANDGLGASIYGGRWNHKGTSIIYTAVSRALCALELLANANRLAVDYAVTPIEVPGHLQAKAVACETLPLNWDAGQPSEHTRDIGTNWAKSLTSPVLVVPSAVIPQEYNYLLNPLHPDFPGILFLKPEPFYFDERLRRAWPSEELR